MHRSETLRNTQSGHLSSYPADNRLEISLGSTTGKPSHGYSHHQLPGSTSMWNQKLFTTLLSNKGHRLTWPQCDLSPSWNNSDQPQPASCIWRLWTEQSCVHSSSQLHLLSERNNGKIKEYSLETQRQASPWGHKPWLQVTCSSVQPHNANTQARLTTRLLGQQFVETLRPLVCRSQCPQLSVLHQPWLPNIRFGNPAQHQQPCVTRDA